MMRLRFLTSVAVTWWCVACQVDGTEGYGSLVTDSAGVRLVLNGPPSPDVEPLNLSVPPAVAIGAAEGPAEYLLFRVAGAARLSDGSIVVADGGSTEIRYFDNAGTHIRTVGGQGDGPGELSSLNGLWRIHGDSLLAYDLNRRNVTVFDERGEYVRSFTVEGTGSTSITSLLLRGVLLDGRLVVVGPTDDQWIGGVSRKPLATYLLDRNGRADSAWAEFPGHETSVVVEGGGATSYAVLFGRRLHVAAAGQRIAVGNDDKYSVRIHGAEGELLLLIGQSIEPAPIDPSAFDRDVEQLLERVTSPQIRERIALGYSQMPRHSTYPAYEAIRISEDGTLWVQDSPPPTGDDFQQWHVYAPEGHRLGIVAIPPSSRVLQVGQSHILTLVRDSLDIERVHLHDIIFDTDARD